MADAPENPQDKSRPPASLTMRQRIIAMSLAALAGIGASMLIWQFIEPDPQSPQVRQSGVANVGGPFTLTAHTGQTLTDQDFADQYKLIYFGYTWCPDVCPLALQFMGETLERLGKNSNIDTSTIQPLLITLDPERDTPRVLARYVDALSSDLPGLIALTGTKAQIAGVADAYKMYYRKSPPLDEADPGSYGIDHMNIIYFMAPDGAALETFINPASPTDVAARMAKVMK